MSQTEFYSRISCSFGSVKKVHLVIFSEVLRSSKSQNSLISGCEIGTPWYTGCRLFKIAYWYPLPSFPWSIKWNLGFLKTKTVSQNLMARRSYWDHHQAATNPGQQPWRFYVTHHPQTRFATLQVGRLTGMRTTVGAHGYSSEDCGGNHEPRSFLSGYRFFLVSSNENSKSNISGF